MWAVVLLLACSAPTPKPKVDAPPPPPAEPVVPAGVEVRHVAWGETKDAWVAVRLDLRQVSLDLLGQAKGAPTGIGEAEATLRAQGRVPVALMNAGMFKPDRTPVGLHVEGPTTFHDLTRCRADASGNFCLLPNGVFSVDALGAHVTDSAAWKPGDGLRLATQSGPALLLGGKVHPKFDPQSTNRHFRNAVGVDAADPQVVWFAMSAVPVRLYDTATLFRDELKCNDALYLDGAVSRMVAPGVSVGLADDRFSGILVAHTAK